MTEEERYYARMNAKLDKQEANGNPIKTVAIIIFGLLAGFLGYVMMHGF